MWADLGSMIDFSGMIMVDVGCERADLGFKSLTGLIRGQRGLIGVCVGRL